MKPGKSTRRRRSVDPVDDSLAPPPKRGKGRQKVPPVKMRIIGGDMGGRTVMYHGDRFTRPMRDSVRENLFNILGKAPKGAIAIDLFSGTGALAFEALSRGASTAYAIDQSQKATRFLTQTAHELGVENRLHVMTGDAFRLGSTLLAPPANDTPWLLFVCPPYKMWDDPKTLGRLNAMIQLAQVNAPPGSVIVAETEIAFDSERLVGGPWDIRHYGRTRLAFCEPASQCGMVP
ncbi:MAG: RsmD family RNA methyltransferase [Planctomycetota bacterium]